MILKRKFQAGGAMGDPNAAPMQEGAPVEGGAMPQEGGEDPLMQIVEVFAQGLQNQDCSMLAQGAQMFLQLVQEAQGAGAPAGAPEGQPVFAKGGKLVSRKPVELQLVRK